MQISVKIKNIGTVIIAAVLAVAMTSCSTERRLAADYVKKKEPLAMLMLVPDYIYKSSFKVPDIEDFDSLPAVIQDSLLYFSSNLVQHIDDSVFLNNYLKGLSLGLRQLGYTVYKPDAARYFIGNGSQAVIVNLAQLQLEEYYESISDEASFGEDEQYNQEIFITALNVNSWIELSRLNHTDTMKRILYSSKTFTDYFDGGFQYFPLTGDVKYYYSIDSLTVDEVYFNASNMGYIYAGYLFDYLMNEYIYLNMPEGRIPEKAFTFDRNSGMLRKSKGQGFTRIQ